MTGDGRYSYAWNGEGLLKSAGTTTYTYDGDGKRVMKSSGTLYWQGVGGSVLAETDTSGNTLNEYIFFGPARIARRDSSGNVYFYFGNHLGSPTITNASGTLCYDADFYPFGGELAFTNNCTQNYKFAGMERDPETGNDHTLFRSFRSNYGRWLSPDPGDLAAADPTNPQSWNRYVYALNSPVNFADPRGLQSCSIRDENGDCMVPESSGPAGGLNNESNPGYQGGEEIAQAEAKYETNVMNANLVSQGIAVAPNGAIWVYLPTSTVCVNDTDCSTTPGGWTELGNLDSETQGLVVLKVAGSLATSGLQLGALAEGAFLLSAALVWGGPPGWSALGLYAATHPNQAAWAWNFLFRQTTAPTLPAAIQRIWNWLH
jgi:RHS repeat-associated protein